MADVSFSFSPSQYAMNCLFSFVMLNHYFLFSQMSPILVDVYIIASPSSPMERRQSKQSFLACSSNITSSKTVLQFIPPCPIPLILLQISFNNLYDVCTSPNKTNSVGKKMDRFILIVSTHASVLQNSIFNFKMGQLEAFNSTVERI